MEEVQISELTEFTSLQRTDLFVAVDNTVTKKIQYGNIVDQLSGDLFIDDITGYTGLVQFATGELGTATGQFEIATGVLDGKVTSNTAGINNIVSSRTGSANFCIYGEKNGTLSDDTFPFSFGAGAAPGQFHGILVPFDCKLIAITADADVSTTVSFTGALSTDGAVDTTLTGYFQVGDSEIMRTAAGTDNTDDQPGFTPLSVSARETINFKVVKVDNGANVTNIRMGAWFSQD